MKISKRKILFLMAERKLTAKALAQAIGMRPNNLSAILSRQSCNPITAARIADGLNVPVTEIEKED